VSVTTLEEVFLKIARDAALDATGEESAETPERALGAAREGSNRVQYTKLDSTDKFAFFKRHMVALFHKRLIISWRARSAWLSAYILPVVICAIGIFGTKLDLATVETGLPSAVTNVEDYVNSRFETTPVVFGSDVRSDCFSTPSDHVELVYAEQVRT
jgi:hypothetical protein